MLDRGGSAASTTGAHDLCPAVRPVLWLERANSARIVLARPVAIVHVIRHVHPTNDCREALTHGGAVGLRAVEQIS